jgi:hypothetical protein
VREVLVQLFETHQLAVLHGESEPRQAIFTWLNRAVVRVVKCDSAKQYPARQVNKRKIQKSVDIHVSRAIVAALRENGRR